MRDFLVYNLPNISWRVPSEHPLFSVFVGFLLALIPQWYREHKRKIAKIKAARASFESTRITLLTFKGQFLIPYRKDMAKFLSAYMSKAREIGFPRLKKRNDFSLDEKIVEQVLSEWRNLRKPFEFYNELTFYSKYWAEELGFISQHVPEYLVTFHFSYGNLLELNKILENRNSVIREYREKSLFEDNINSKHVVDAAHQHWDFAKSCKDLVDTALDFNRRCEEHLKQYERRFFHFSTLFGLRKFFNFKMKTQYDSLMPPKSYLSSYDKQIQESVEKKEGIIKRVLSKFFW
jgi:hypothetical protein